MLSDEEKKAIEILNKFIKANEEFICQECGFNQQDEGKSLKILLNLIKKQSKEIEDYIENKELINQTLGLEKDSDINKTLEKIIILNNYEDKIKAKIEVLDKAIKVNRNSAKNSDRVTVRLINDKINELYKAKEILQSLLELKL